MEDDMKIHPVDNMNTHNHGNMNTHDNMNMDNMSMHNHDDMNMDNMNMHNHDNMNIDNMNMHNHDNVNIENMNMHNHDNMNMDNMDNGGMMGHMGMMMHSPWFKAFTDGPFLFEAWMTKTVSGLVAAMLFSVCLAIIYECTNYAFNVYHLRTEKWHTRQNKIIAHALLSLLKSFSLVIAYVMMLCVMTFNLWILLAVIVGSGAGHLVGRPLISIALKKKKTQKNCDRGTKEMLHDFEPLNDKSEEKYHRKVVTKSLVQEKLLRYDYDDDNV